MIIVSELGRTYRIVSVFEDKIFKVVKQLVVYQLSYYLDQTKTNPNPIRDAISAGINETEIKIYFSEALKIFTSYYIEVFGNKRNFLSPFTVWL